MRHWSLRFKMTALVVVLTAGGSLAASAIHAWYDFRTLKEDVRGRAAATVTEIASSITTPQELADRELLDLQIRNIMGARPTLRWLEVYAYGPNGLKPIASSREELPPGPSDLVGQAFAQGYTLTIAGAASDGEAWLAAAPIRLGRNTTSWAWRLWRR